MDETAVIINQKIGSLVDELRRMYGFKLKLGAIDELNTYHLLFQNDLHGDDGSTSAILMQADMRKMRLRCLYGKDGSFFRSFEQVEDFCRLVRELAPGIYERAKARTLG
jgi:hypothetical protein